MRSSRLARGTVARGTVARGTVAITAAAVSAALLTAGHADAASAPPWEASSNAVGTLTFYDAAGNVITTGATDAPFAAYAVGSATPRSGDTLAGLAFANPQPSTTPNKFFTEQAGPFTTYPATGAPASVSSQGTNPVYTSGTGDTTIDQFESQVTQSTSSGYLDMIQIRVYTSNSSSQISRTYDDADLLIDPTTHTWTETYPTNAGGTTTPDSTSLSISAPATVGYGGRAKITGTLRDTTKGSGLAGQAVGLFAGSKRLARVTSTSGGALAVKIKLTGGVRVHWAFVGSSAYKASSSAARSIGVTTAASIAADHATIKHGRTVTFYGSTTPATSGIKVYLQELFGKKWKSISSAKQKRQKLPNGRTTVGYRFGVKLTKKGTYHFRVYKTATSTLRSSVSRIFTEHVK